MPEISHSKHDDACVELESVITINIHNIMCCMDMMHEYAYQMGAWVSI